MSPHDLDFAVAGVLWSAVVTYAVFAGADFGGGVWDLLASGPLARAQRRAVSRAMGPVWEANHVWLIFLITGLFTAFPAAFSTLALGLYVPFTLVVFGIVLRGSAFAFRAHGAPEEAATSPWATAFGVASTITPFLLGACAGAVASGAVPSGSHPSTAELFSSWTSPFALVCGGLATSICAGLAAAYLAVEETDAHRPGLAEDFRRRALGAGAATLVLAIVALPLTRGVAPALWSGLTGRGLPLMVLALVCAAMAGVSMLTRHYRVARVAAAGQVGLILLAWAVAQSPYLVPPTISVEGSASPPETMGLFLVVFGIGAAFLLPSLLLLFRVFKGQNPAAG